MKNIVIGVLLCAWHTVASAGEPETGKQSDQLLESYISNFDYEARNEMKIDSKGLLQLMMAGKVQLLDIRFHEEQAAWKLAYSTSIPLNELPSRLHELDSNKIIVTACPHKDRAIMAMLYLRSKGIKAKYLSDGLLGLAGNLRGDDAEEFIYTMEVLKK